MFNKGYHDPGLWIARIIQNSWKYFYTAFSSDKDSNLAICSTVATLKITDIRKHKFNAGWMVVVFGDG